MCTNVILYCYYCMLRLFIWVANKVLSRSLSCTLCVYRSSVWYCLSRFRTSTSMSLTQLQSTVSRQPTVGLDSSAIYRSPAVLLVQLSVSERGFDRSTAATARITVDLTDQVWKLAFLVERCICSQSSPVVMYTSSVCRLSVTRVYCEKTTEDRISRALHWNVA